MRILICSWYFPPSDTVGSLRVGAFARHMRDAHHDVRVLTARNPPYPQTLEATLDDALVIRAGWRDVNWAQNALAGGVKRAMRWKGASGECAGGNLGSAPVGPETARRNGSEDSAPRQMASALSQWYATFINWPDARIGWLPGAIAEGRRLLKGWRPDIVFCSGPPFTAFLVGWALARFCGARLVLEFRDRWSDDPYYPSIAMRRRFDGAAEKMLARRAAAIVTVSDPWATAYAQRFNKPVIAIYNGFDTALPEKGACMGDRDTRELQIGYFGSIYRGYRDPSPLFAALALLAEQGVDSKVFFYGTNPDDVEALAHRYNISERIQVRSRVPNKQSLSIQRKSDILLLMQWNNPKESGNVPAKLFEYFSARRPILALGLETGEPARFLRERQAGYLINKPVAIAAQIARWAKQKEELGYIPPLPNEASLGLSRSEQFLKLESFLSSLRHC